MNLNNGFFGLIRNIKISIGLLILITIVSCRKTEPKTIDTIETQELTIEEVGTLAVATNPYFLFLSDVHLNTSRVSTDYGEDTGIALWNSAKKKINAITTSAEKPRFIIYTGDMPDHYPDRGDVHDKNIKTVLEDLNTISNGIPLFYAPGNNDPLGGDYHSFTNASNETPLSLTPTLAYPALHADTIYSMNRTYGYYSARPFKGLRIIAMNTVLLGSQYHDDNSNDSHKSQLKHGNQQMQWLRSQLQNAEKINEKVYIIMHIQPGKDAYSSAAFTWAYCHWLYDFLDNVNTYEKTITGIMYGHTHMDELKRMTSKTLPSGYSEIAISSPGISPNHKNNPGFKTVNYNSNYEFTNFTTHFSTPSGLNWDNSYSFSDIFKSKTGQTIKDRLIEIEDVKIVAGYMSQTYKVKNGYGNTSTIQQGIDVDYCK